MRIIILILIVLTAGFQQLSADNREYTDYDLKFKCETRFHAPCTVNGDLE